MAIGVSRITCWSGFLPSRRNATKAWSAPRTWPPGNCSIVPVRLPALICPSASGKASKPISFTFPRRSRAFRASSAPSAISSFAQTMTSGGFCMPARADSVMAKPFERSKPAVFSKTILYLSLRFAAFNVVGPNMREDAWDLVDAAVNGNDRNFGIDRFLNRGRQSIDVIRADHDTVDAFGDRCLDVRGLLGRTALAIGYD